MEKYERKCKTCGKVLLIEKFAKAGCIKGKVYYRHECNKCYIKRKGDRRREKSIWVKEYKMTQKCVICGNDDFRVLEFDHLGEKLNNVGDMARLGFSKNKILEEIKKCQVLCANCHRIKTYEETQIKKMEYGAGCV